jgi:pimeloyl-ACP methyl ester carboxylesterase
MHLLSILFLLLLLAAVLLTILPVVPSPSADNPPLRMERQGRGQKTVVLLPGLGCGPSLWEGVINHLQNDYALYAARLAGYDGMPPIPPPYFATWVEALAQYIRDEPLDRPILIGHSLGGNLALRLAICYPDLSGGLIIVDGMPISPPLGRSETLASRCQDMDALAQVLYAYTPEEWASQLQAFVSLKVRRPEDAQRLLQMFLKVDRDTHIGSFREGSTTDLRPELPKITVPVHVIAPVPPAGKLAKTAQQLRQEAYSLFQDLYQGTPKLTLHLIDESRHFMTHDQPERLHAAIRAGLRSMA